MLPEITAVTVDTSQITAVTVDTSQITAVTLDTLLVGLDRAVANTTRMLSGTRVWLDVTSHEQQPVALRYNTRREPRQRTQVPVSFPATGGSCQVVSTWQKPLR